jgi:hypothetical protein
MIPKLFEQMTTVFLPDTNNFKHETVMHYICFRHHFSGVEVVLAEEGFGGAVRSARLAARVGFHLGKPVLVGFHGFY